MGTGSGRASQTLIVSMSGRCLSPFFHSLSLALELHQISILVAVKAAENPHSFVTHRTQQELHRQVAFGDGRLKGTGPLRLWPGVETCHQSTPNPAPPPVGRNVELNQIDASRGCQDFSGPAQDLGPVEMRA